MDSMELRQSVGAILIEEERQEVDWALVRRLSRALDEALTAESYVDCPQVVRHYLDDDDIRARDDAYAHRQRDAVRRYVQSGEYFDSRPIPFWGCLLFVAVLLAPLAWWLL